MPATLFLFGLAVLFFGIFGLILSRGKRADVPQEPLTMPKMLGWSVLVGVIGLNLFAYDHNFGIGFGLFLCSLIAAIVLSYTPERRTPAVWVFAATGIVAALFFGWRANEFVQRINIIVALLSILALLLLRTVDIAHWHGLWLVSATWHFFDRHLQHLPRVFRTFLRPGDTQSRKLGLVVRTLLITLVVVILFAFLLSQADPIFGQLVERVTDQLLGRVILSLILAAFLTITLSLHTHIQEKIPPSLRFFSFTEIFVPAVALALLFGAFLAVQAQYLFGSHDAVRAFDLTYSDYVRKGFIELLITTFFGSILCYIVILKQHALSDRNHVRLLQVANIVLILELFLLLGSALKRDWLYMDTYGLTRVRLIGEVFLFWLAGTLLLLFLRNAWTAMRERQLLSGVFALSCLVVLYWNVTNMDAQIAKADPPRGQPKDLFYVSLLSADAVDGWLEAIRTGVAKFDQLRTKPLLTEGEKRELANIKLTAATLQAKVDELTFVHGNRTWQDWNHAQFYANRVIRKNEQWFEDATSCLLREIEQYQLEHNTQLAPYELERIYDFSYPFVQMKRLPTMGRELDWIRTEGLPSASDTTGSFLPDSCQPGTVARQSTVE